MLKQTIDESSIQNEKIIIRENTGSNLLMIAIKILSVKSYGSMKVCKISKKKYN